MTSEFLIALMAGSIAASADHCEGPKPPHPIKPKVAVEASSACPVVSVGDLAGLSALEYVDVRPPSEQDVIRGPRRLNLNQLAERPVESGVVRVLLGNGLDDQQLAARCTPNIADSSVVLRGGIKTWQLSVRGSDDQRADTSHVTSAVSPAQVMGSEATLVLDRDQHQTLANALSAIQARMVGPDNTDSAQRPLVFIDQVQWAERAGWRDADLYYVRGGAEAMTAELTLARALADATLTPLTRPCYLP